MPCNSLVDNQFRYCGEYYDEESGLVYLRNRYYDSITGRFVTEDPIRDGLNWYAYASNNPVMFIDLSGLFTAQSRLSYNPNAYSEDVRTLQNELAWKGYLTTEDVDGYFGPNTLDAVNRYKTDKGLTNIGAYEGVVGLTTWTSLGLSYDLIEAEFKLAPKKQIIDFDINFGVGIYGEFNVAGVSIEVGGKSYYSLSDVAVRPSITSEGSIQANLPSIFSAGAKGHIKIDTASGNLLEREGYAGIKIGEQVIGLDALTNGSDVIISLGAGAYLGVGGEIQCDINLSELFRNFK